MVMSLLSFIVPVMLVLIITLLITIIGNRSIGLILGTISMVLTVLIWQYIIEDYFIVLVALFLGMGIWLTIFRGD